MDLRILEHRVRVLSIARGSLWLYMHPLLKMLLLPQRSRCPPVGRGRSAGGRGPAGEGVPGPLGGRGEGAERAAGAAEPRGESAAAAGWWCAATWGGGAGPRRGVCASVSQCSLEMGCVGSSGCGPQGVVAAPQRMCVCGHWHAQTHRSAQSLSSEAWKEFRKDVLLLFGKPDVSWGPWVAWTMHWAPVCVVCFVCVCVSEREGEGGERERTRTVLRSVVVSMDH